MHRFFHVAAAWALTGVLAAGCASAPPPEAIPEPAATAVSRSDSLAQASAALTAEQYNQAAALYERILRDAPGEARAHLGLAEALLATGQPDAAFAHFEQAAADPLQQAAARQGTAMALLGLGRVEEARVVLTELVQTHSGLWRAWNALGYLHDRQKQWAEAEAAYRRALEMAPPQATAPILNNLGVSAMAQGRFDEAIQHFREAILARSDMDVARANLRLALGMQGRYAEAMAGLAADDLPTALNNMGYLAMMQGDLPRAEAYFQRALEASPSYYDKAARNLALLTSTRAIEGDSIARQGVVLP